MREVDLPAHLERIGTRLQNGLSSLAQETGVPLKIGGIPAVSFIGFEHSEGQALLTLFTHGMLERGFLVGGGFHATYGHRDEHMDAFLAASAEVFAELAAAIAKGDIAGRLGAPVRHSGFERLA